MKQSYQWPDVKTLNESVWEKHDWPLLENLSNEDLKNFDIAYPELGVDFNLFMNEQRIAPSINEQF